MFASNGKEVTVDFFVGKVQARSPSVIPKYWMSDFDWCQLNVIKRRYPLSQVFLCWWHVPHAWQQHFVILHYPDLWVALKQWYRITEEMEFEACWQDIQALAPPSFIQYITVYWLPVKKLWSGIYRKGRSIHEQGDTNMLVEAHVIHL